MFCCCVPTFRSSGPKTAQSERLLCHCRRWLSPLSRIFWSCGRRHQQSCTQEILDELVWDFNYSNSLDMCQVHQATQDQCYCEESTLSLDEACTMLMLKEGTVENFLHSWVPSFPDRSISNITTNFCIDQVFISAQWVLGQQFNSTLSPILGTWPDQKLQDIWQSLHCACLEVKKTYEHLKWPAWDLKNCAPLLLLHRELLGPTEAEAEGPAPGLLPAAEPEKGLPVEREATPALFQPSPQGAESASPPSAVPELEQVLAASICVLDPEPQSAGPSTFLGVFTPADKTESEPTQVPEASCHQYVTPKNQLNEEKADILDFPPKLVAEQLTYMDAELFKKVCVQHCLGSVWTKRNKPGNEHLAPTVRATIAQFNSVANCVITTCLGNPRMTARDRAMVVEHWIKVAKACQILQNYSSLHAILAALQTVSIHRLKKTWQKVSRKRFQKFKKLCTEDKPQGRKLLIKERPSNKFASLLMDLQGARKRVQKKGVVPYLGTFLTDLVMLDTAMEDYLEGNEINHEKRNKEYKVLTEIMLLQVAAENYNIEPKDSFQAWFQSMEQLSDDESYILSCQLEPRS
ncbi:ral guanine nucleotide dissociation stimulator-like isoform X1 [Callorhinus ursinus]|uniref:Ral guanine nucleotide dissociation stimulator-like n=1 Tax=Callorhinus ursinus TaxID=34884 RepID=A0A3Q7PG06_CALUR|nr:ral guanine nucleotide dissociation stimulator-like [Callorhinus ursinus]XP_025732709.1 ral guanine nucleotide dissociation stimulator-like [Callorhinus ursinus]